MYDAPQAIGNRLLVEIELDEEKAIKSDIIVIAQNDKGETSDEYNERVMQSATIGEVIQLGEAAQETAILSNAENELCPGKLVLFLQNAGTAYTHKESDKMYRIIGRGDVMAVVGEVTDE